MLAVQPPTAKSRATTPTVTTLATSVYSKRAAPRRSDQSRNLIAVAEIRPLCPTPLCRAPVGAYLFTPELSEHRKRLGISQHLPCHSGNRQSLTRNSAHRFSRQPDRVGHRGRDRRARQRQHRKPRPTTALVPDQTAPARERRPTGPPPRDADGSPQLRGHQAFRFQGPLPCRPA